MALKVLVIDDDPEAADHLDALVRDWGYEARTAFTGRGASQASREWRPHLAFVDLHLPDIDGIDLLRTLRIESPGVEAVIVSGDSQLRAAVTAAASGALCFLEKPVSPVTLRCILAQAEHRRLRTNQAGQNGDESRLGELVTQNPRMREAFDLVRCVAPTDANVLIAGENGTGKELVANALHSLSLRADKPFIKVNCAAIPEELIEAELFGHRRGAFTGAIADRIGLFEAARGGTLLLDEIGEMPAHLQSKLLRVLQDRQARPLGGGSLVDLDFRLICATNCDLRAATIDGRFRQDLFFRINTITVALPPLRERPEDILLLTEIFVRRFGAQYRREDVTLDEAACARLLAHEWRGNVRELEHAIERAVIVARSSRLTLDELPECFHPSYSPPRGASRDGTGPILPLAELERLAIVRALEHTRGNKRAAAALLGIYRPTLYSKLRKYGIMESAASARDPRALASCDLSDTYQLSATRPGNSVAGKTPNAGNPSQFFDRTARG
jgi:DNA-binding NtrC family response regulator